MKRIGKSTETNCQVYVNEQYYVVAQNGIIIGAVRYAFNDGEQWCFAIRLHSGDMPAHGVSRFEIGSHFDLIPGEPPWTMPTVQQPQYDPKDYPLCEAMIEMERLAAPEPKLMEASDLERLALAIREEYELIGWDRGRDDTSHVCLLDSEGGKARESGAQP